MHRAQRTVSLFSYSTLPNPYPTLLTPLPSFNNVGLPLFDDGVAQFAASPGVLLQLAFLQIMGLTGFPVLLRTSVWALARFGPPRARPAARFALANPHRCSHTLFGRAETVILAASIVGLNLLCLGFFLGTSMRPFCDRAACDPSAPAPPRHQAAVMGFFQVVNSRATGLQVFDIKQMSPVMAVLFAFMMWFAATPFVSVIIDARAAKRRVNAKEDDPATAAGAGKFFLASQSTREKRAQRRPLIHALYTRYLTRHMPYLLVAFIAVTCAEQRQLFRQPGPGWSFQVSLFDVLFEILSAYGTNGLTMGSPTRGAALSADFGAFSKVVLIGIMLLGRHRHMPTHADSALDRHVHRLKVRPRTHPQHAYDAFRFRSPHRSLTACVASPPPLLNVVFRRCRQL